MMNLKSIYKFVLLVIFLLIFIIPASAQEVVGCYSSSGAYKPRGSTWVDYRNGVAYDCVCGSSGASCSPRSSSSGSSSSAYSSQTQMMESLLQPIINNLFKLIFSGPSTKPTQQQTYQKSAAQLKREEEERQKKVEEYNAKVLEQITNTKNEFLKQVLLQTEQKKSEIVSDFKNRFAIAEATKSVKQLNCAAFTSLESTKIRISDFKGSKDLETSLEQASTLLDFTNQSGNNCPPITVQIPEVNANQLVSFQEMFYNYIVNRSDSIRSTIDTLKIQKEKNDTALQEKGQKVEKASKKLEEQKTAIKSNNSTTNSADNQLLIDAMKELEDAENGLQTAKEIDLKINEEINQKEKHIDALTKMRATYDVPKKQISTEQSTNK